MQHNKLLYVVEIFLKKHLEKYELKKLHSLYIFPQFLMILK